MLQVDEGKDGYEDMNCITVMYILINVKQNLLHFLAEVNMMWKRGPIFQRDVARDNISLKKEVNPLNPELNPICYLLALLGAHHFLHVSRIRVK